MPRSVVDLCQVHYGQDARCRNELTFAVLELAFQLVDFGLVGGTSAKRDEKASSYVLLLLHCMPPLCVGNGSAVS